MVHEGHFTKATLTRVTRILGMLLARVFVDPADKLTDDEIFLQLSQVVIHFKETLWYFNMELLETAILLICSCYALHTFMTVV